MVGDRVEATLTFFQENYLEEPTEDELERVLITKNRKWRPQRDW